MRRFSGAIVAGGSPSVRCSPMLSEDLLRQVHLLSPPSTEPQGNRFKRLVEVHRRHLAKYGPLFLQSDSLQWVDWPLSGSLPIAPQTPGTKGPSPTSSHPSGTSEVDQLSDALRDWFRGLTPMGLYRSTASPKEKDSSFARGLRTATGVPLEVSLLLDEMNVVADQSRWLLDSFDASSCGKCISQMSCGTKLQRLTARIKGCSTGQIEAPLFYSPLQHMSLPSSRSEPDSDAREGREKYLNRKQDEFNRMALLAKVLHLETGSVDVAEIGCGRGHLLRAMELLGLSNAVGLDGDGRFVESSSSGFTASARVRRGGGGKVESIRHSFPRLKGGFGGDATRRLHLTSPLVLGLHTCGHLADECLRFGVDRGSPAIINVPCCYHKLRLPQSWDVQSPHDCQPPLNSDLSRVVTPVGLQLAGRARNPLTITPIDFVRWYWYSFFRCSLRRLLEYNPSWVTTPRQPTTAEDGASPLDAFFKVSQLETHPGCWGVTTPPTNGDKCRVSSIQLLLWDSVNESALSPGTIGSAFVEYCRNWQEPQPTSQGQGRLPASPPKIICSDQTMSDFLMEPDNFLRAQEQVSFRWIAQWIAASVEVVVMGTRVHRLEEMGYDTVVGPLLSPIQSSRFLGVVAVRRGLLTTPLLKP